MRILHIPNYYFPHIGGIEQTARDIVKAVGSTEQKVICFNENNKNVIDEVDGISVTRCGAVVKIASQSISFSYNKKLKKMFKDFNPNIVIFHYPNPFAAHFLLKILKRKRNCKLILWWHLDITKQKLLGKIFKSQTERLLKKAHKIIYTSPNYLSGSPYLSRYKNKCELIPSCINEERLELSESIKEKAQIIRKNNLNKTICFAVGRHVEYKGYEYLIQASKKLDDSFKFYIGGKGKLTDSLMSLAKSDTKIEFLGKLTDDELKAYMLACDIYCFPSITKNEAFGLALAEAMYFGKPAVTFTIEGSGVNFVSLNGVTGIEVENRNSEKYAEAIKFLAENTAICDSYGRAAKKRVEDMFTESLFKEKVNSVFQAL